MHLVPPNNNDLCASPSDMSGLARIVSLEDLLTPEEEDVSNVLPTRGVVKAVLDEAWRADRMAWLCEEQQWLDEVGSLWSG